MSVMIDLADRGILPDRLIRMGIRYLDRKRLQEEDHHDPEQNRRAKEAFVKLLRKSPIAAQTPTANEQHYELPSAFFEKVLGPQLKYSGNYWPEVCSSLDEAERATLALYCNRAELAGGMQVLELGCGWGSLSLWMARHYPNSRVVAVSNSQSQKEFIRSRCDEGNINNLEVIAQDINNFSIDREFDRVVSVEMFEHMRNWPRLLENISIWLKPEGKLFIHIFTHHKFAYTFESNGEDNWMGRHFFTGGIMPSAAGQ